MVDNMPNQRFKCRMKNLVVINDEPQETYNTNNQIKFKTTLLKSILCNYSDAWILLKGIIIISGGTTDVTATDEVIRQEKYTSNIFKLCTIH